MCVLVSTGSALAQTSAGLDQYQLDGSVSGLLHSTNPVGQWFTVGVDGILWAAEFSIEAVVGTTEDLQVEVVDVSAGLPGVPLYSTALAVGEVGTHFDTLDADQVTSTLIDISPARLEVTAGDQIGIRLTTLEESSRGYKFRFKSSDPYPDGEMLSMSGSNASSDLTFKTFVAIPIFHDGFENGLGSWSLAVP
jgi:hypothetical protein